MAVYHCLMCRPGYSDDRGVTTGVRPILFFSLTREERSSYTDIPLHLLSSLAAKTRSPGSALTGDNFGLTRSQQAMEVQRTLSPLGSVHLGSQV